jgi:hypothetical protein
VSLAQVVLNLLKICMLVSSVTSQSSSNTIADELKKNESLDSKEKRVAKEKKKCLNMVERALGSI